MPIAQVTVPFDKSFNFGVGLESTNASPMGKVVQGTVSSITGAPAATTVFDISRIENTSDLEKKLGVDVKAGYNAGPFANVNDRFEFASSQQIQENSLSLAIRAVIQLGHDSIDDPQLTKEASDLVQNSEAFRARFGDMFVRGIDRGGIFFALLNLSTREKETSESISNIISGAYAAFSGDAQTKLEEMHQNFHSELNITLFHAGGPIGLVPDKIDNPVEMYSIFKQWLKSFVDDPDHMSVPFNATLAPTIIANGPLPLNAAQAEHAQDVLGVCLQQRAAAFDGLNLMNAIIHSPERYKFTAPITMADIRAAAAGYQKDLDLIGLAASTAMNHPESAKMPADFAEENKVPFPQGIPPTPMPEVEQTMVTALAVRGKELSAGDPLLAILHDAEPEGPNRLGFEIGLGIADGQILPGTGKDAFVSGLEYGVSKEACQRGIEFTVDRNREIVHFTKGSAVIANNPAVAAARNQLQPASNKWLGFAIAAGIFGKTADGGDGNTALGPGSKAILNSLGGDAQIGFKAALGFFKPTP
jgi:hypothetical protein